MKGNLPIILILLVGGVLVYGNTLRAPFHFDDYHVVANRSLESLWQQCKDPNRFVPHLSFYLNARLHGTDVEGYHAINLLVHVGTAFFVFLLLREAIAFFAAGRRATDAFVVDGSSKAHRSDNHERYAALLGALVFLAHPLATQAVSYICQRYTSIATFFYVAAIVFYLRARRSSVDCHSPRLLCGLGNYLLACAAALLAMLSKEFAVTLPLVLIVAELSNGAVNRQTIVRRCLYLIPLVAISAIVPAMHLGGSPDSSATVAPKDPLSNWAPPGMPRSAYLFTQLDVIVSIYLRLLLAPVGQSVDHGFVISYSLGSPRTMTALAVLIGLLLACVWLWRRNRLAAYGILWFFATLAPTSSIIPNSEFVAEHRLYLPLISLSFIFSAVYLLVERRYRKAAWVLFVVPVILGALAIRRNVAWGDELALWQDAIRQAPHKARPYFAVGTIYERRRQFNEGANAYRAAIRHFPGYALAWNNLGNMCQYQENLDEAIHCYTEALRLFPNYPEAHYNLGLVYNKLERLPEALEETSTATGLRGVYPEAHYNLGMIYQKMERWQEAETAYTTAISQSPGYFPAYLNLAAIYRKQGDYAKAVRCYHACIQLEPGFVQGYLDMAELLGAAGQRDQAFAVLGQVTQLPLQEPADTYYRLARAYYRLGDERQARHYLRLAVDVDPKIGGNYYDQIRATPEAYNDEVLREILGGSE